MAYCTYQDVLTYTGVRPEDFKKTGNDMSDAEFDEFIETLIKYATARINRYCNVTSFESHTVTEYHDGRGYNGEEADTYCDRDREFLLWEQPVTSITTVQIDEAGDTAIPSWYSCTVRSSLAAGEYISIIQRGFAKIRFTTKVPMYGHGNVKLVYTAGYSSGSQELDEIRLCATRIISNMLLYKKKIQEAVTIRNKGVRDYSQMFMIFSEVNLITDDIAAILNQYKRMVCNVDAYE